MSVLLGLALVQQHYGLGWMQRVEIKPSASYGYKIEGKASRARLPEDYHTALTAERAVVWEDGQPLLNRRRKPAEVMQLGGGSYAFSSEHVHFSAPDDSAALSNGRHYALVTPKQFDHEVFGWLILLWLAALAWQVWQRLVVPATAAPRDMAGESSASSDGKPMCGDGPRARQWPWVFGLALLGSLAQLWVNAEISSGGLIVKGMPESDASGWHEMAQGFADGRGITTAFESQRPFYSIALGAVYVLTGSHLIVAKVFHAVILAVVATLLASLGRALGARWAGLAAAVTVVGARGHGLMISCVLTENLGLLYAAVGALALWLVAWRTHTYWGDEADGTSRARGQSLPQHPVLWAGIAGWVVGLGNLGSGVLLLLLPLAAVWLTVKAWHHGVAKPAGWRHHWAVRARRSMAVGLAFTAGVSLVLLPWMVRQKARLGVFTLSANTGELLYTGARPGHTRWNADIVGMADAAGLARQELGARQTFFMDRYKAQVASDPVGYAKQVAGNTHVALSAAPLHEPALSTAALLLLLALGAHRASRIAQPSSTAALPRARHVAAGLAPSIAAVGLGIGWCYCSKASFPFVIVTALAICWWRARNRAERDLITVLGLTLAAGLLLSGMAAATAVTRFWHVMSWASFLLVLIGLGHLHELLSAALARWLGHSTARVALTVQPATPRCADITPVRAWQNTVIFLAASSALALAIVGARQLLPPQRYSPPLHSLEAEVSNLARWAIAQHPDTAARVHSSTASARYVAMSDRALRLAAGEDIGVSHLDYQRSATERWIFFPHLILAEGLRGATLPMHCREDIRAWAPAYQPAIWVYVPGAADPQTKRSDIPTKELIAIIPVRSTPDGRAEAVLEQTHWCPLPAK